MDRRSAYVWAGTVGPISGSRQTSCLNTASRRLCICVARFSRCVRSTTSALVMKCSLDCRHTLLDQVHAWPITLEAIPIHLNIWTAERVLWLPRQIKQSVGSTLQPCLSTGMVVVRCRYWTLISSLYCNNNCPARHAKNCLLYIAGTCYI